MKLNKNKSEIITNLLICFPSARSGAAGGSANSALLIGRNLDRSKFTPLFVYPEYGSIIEKVEEHKLQYTILHKGETTSRLGNVSESKSVLKRSVILLAYIPYFFRVVRFLKKTDVHLINTNDLFTTLLWGIAGKLTGIPVVWHVRQYRSGKFLDRIRLWAVSYVVFVAEQNKRKFESKLLAKIPYTVIHNGVDLSLFDTIVKKDAGLRKELGLPARARLVGFVGVLTDRKRPEVFVRTALKVAARIEDTCFLLVGKDNPPNREALKEWGSYQKYLRHIINSEGFEGASEHFVFLGYRSDVHRIMQEFNVLVFTSEEFGEAFPRVVIEAMASSVPVVATRSAGVPEAVEDGVNGFLVDNEEEGQLVDALANRVVTLIENAHLAESFGAAGRKKAERLFDAREVARKTEAVYNSLLSQPAE